MAEKTPPQEAPLERIKDAFATALADFLEEARSADPQGDEWHPTPEGVKRSFTAGHAALIIGMALASDRAHRHAREQQLDSGSGGAPTEANASASSDGELPQLADYTERDKRLLEVCDILLWQTGAELFGMPSAANMRPSVMTLTESMDRLLGQTLGATRNSSEDGSDPPVET